MLENKTKRTTTAKLFSVFTLTYRCNIFSSDLFVTVINAIALSKLYSSLVWSNASSKTLSVKSSQLGLLLEPKKLNTWPHHSRTWGGSPWKSSPIFETPFFAFKCTTGSVLTYLISQLVTRWQISDRWTRNALQMNIHLFKIATSKISFHWRIGNLWNSFDKDIKLCKSPAKF